MIFVGCGCPRFAPRFWALTWAKEYSLRPPKIPKKLVEHFDSFKIRLAAVTTESYKVRLMGLLKTSKPVWHETKPHPVLMKVKRRPG